MEANSGLPLLVASIPQGLRPQVNAYFFVCSSEQTNNLRVLCGRQHNMRMQAALFRVEVSDRD